MNEKQERTAAPMTDADYIAAEVNAGLLMGSAHFTVAQVQPSYDTATCHVVLMVYTNQCGALLAALTALAQIGLTISGMHRLSGKYLGCIEVDVVRNPRPPRPRKALPIHPVPMDEYTYEDLTDEGTDRTVYQDIDIPF